jgi:hypothetical protein
MKFFWTWSKCESKKGIDRNEMEQENIYWWLPSKLQCLNSCPSNSNFPEWNNTWALWRIITHNFCCNISPHHCASGTACGASRLIFTSLISEFINPSILLIGTSFNRTIGVWIYTGARSGKYTSIYFFFLLQINYMKLYA